MSLLRAKLVVPVISRPIDDGGIVIRDNCVSAVGPWSLISSRFPDEPVTDLGNATLMPGLVNAHCHLDYTAMVGGLPAPKYFPDWIKGILAFKAHWSFSDFAQSSIAGAHMLLKSGTTSVADIESVPELLPHIWEATPLRMISLLEMTCVRSRRSAMEVLRDATTKMDSLPPGIKSTALSPHALYSTTPELVRLAAREARKRGCMISVHVAESVEEWEMFMQGRGRMFDWMKKQRDMDDCGLRSPVKQLSDLEVLGNNFLAVHVNHLAPGDALLLARTRSSVVHCPRSHAYFQHAPFPLDELTGAGVNVCLGTDSLASMKRERRQLPKLDMFAELQALAQNRPFLAPERILRMATVNGAQALGMSGRIGQLSPGSYADIICVDYPDSPKDVYAFLVNRRPAVRSVMIDGKWQP